MPTENHMEIVEVSEDEAGTIVHWRPCRCDRSTDHSDLDQTVPKDARYVEIDDPIVDSEPDD